MPPMTPSAGVCLSGLPSSQVAPLQAVRMSLVIFLSKSPRAALSMGQWVTQASPTPGSQLLRGQQDHFPDLPQLFPYPPLPSLFTTLPLTLALSFDLANPGPWRNQTV